MYQPPVFRVTLGCGLALLLTASLSLAQEAKLPDGLKHVPPDAMGFVHLRVGDFVKSPVGTALLEELRKDREAAKGLAHVEKTLGVALSDVESVTLLALMPPVGSLAPGRWNAPPRYSPRRPTDFDMKKLAPPKFRNDVPEDKKPAGGASPVLFQDGIFRERVQVWDVHEQEMFDDRPFMGPLVMVTATKDLDRKQILRSHLMIDQPRDPFHGSSRGQSVLFLSDRTVMIGAPWEIGRYSEMIARNPGPKTTPLKSALALGATPHLVVAGGHVSPEMRRMIFMPFGGPDIQAMAAIAPLLQTEAGLTLDFGKSIDLTVQFNAPTEASAANALQAVKTARVLGELALESMRMEGEPGGWKLDLEKGLVKALADATIEQKGTTVRATVKMDVSSALIKHFTKDIVATFRQKGDRTKTVNNLKMIGLALHNHHDTFKRLPAAGIGDRDGKPLLSWRVAILPFIEHAALYKQFDLNQPWDHPTNKKLIAKMPDVFAIPGLETKEGETHLRALVGGDAMFEPRIGVSLAQITDGTSNTFMIVEAKDPTIWTRPDDLPYDPKGALPKFGTTPDGFNVVLGDGSVRFIRSNTAEQVLRAYITRNGGEVIPDDR